MLEAVATGAPPPAGNLGPLPSKEEAQQQRALVSAQLNAYVNNVHNLRWTRVLCCASLCSPNALS